MVWSLEEPDSCTEEENRSRQHLRMARGQEGGRGEGDDEEEEGLHRRWTDLSFFSMSWTEIVSEVASVAEDSEGTCCHQDEDEFVSKLSSFDFVSLVASDWTYLVSQNFQGSQSSFSAFCFQIFYRGTQI